MTKTLGDSMATWNSRGLRGSTLEEFINRTNEKYADEIGIGIVIFFFLAAYFASGFGEYTQKKPERMAFLSQPATDFEKYLLRWLVYIPGFIVGYFLIFYMQFYQ